MRFDREWRQRLAVLAMLVKRAPQRPGRTALMKFAYLLQTVRQVPLGYHFELYNYGPYDNAVLSDLSQAETLKAIKSKTVSYPSGVGYEYSPCDKGYENLLHQVAEEINGIEPSVKWVLDEFGGETASQLELISTIVFAEREMQRKEESLTKADLCQRVKHVKPRFTEEDISAKIDELERKELIFGVSK